MWLVAGLGNPGSAYEKTRHNAGFRVVASLADAYGISLNRRKFDAVYGKGRIGDVDTLLMAPMAYMNRSGPPVQKFAAYFRVPIADILVVHDDIDLEFGRLKIKEKGGDGGHKGLRSITDALGGGGYVRLRIGVGRPETGKPVTDHVLGGFNRDEARRMNRVVSAAKDAVVTILLKGTREAMNRFNDKRTQIF
jgi:PTH1 family peptidyl-tRNA hydrolase